LTDGPHPALPTQRPGKRKHQHELGLDRTPPLQG
jgi:hypothetical protein